MKIGLHIADFTWPGGPQEIASDLARVATTAENARRSSTDLGSAPHSVATRGEICAATSGVRRVERERGAEPNALGDGRRPRRLL